MGSNPDQEMAPGDRMEIINGVSGDTRQMLAACKDATELEIAFKRCEERSIAFPDDGSDGKQLGLTVSLVDGMTLGIQAVAPDGLIAEHNKAFPMCNVAVDDRIIA